MTKKRNEIVIGYTDQKSQVSGWFSKDSRFNDNVQDHLTESLAGVGPLAKGDASQFLELKFDDGGGIRILLITKDISVFQFHTAVRKHLASAVKSKGTVQINVKRLSKPHQQLAADSVQSLAVLETWEAPQYGNRAKDKKSKTPPKLEFESGLSASELNRVLVQAETISQKTNLVRTLAVTPANVLNPGSYKKILRERARKGKYSYSFSDREALKKKGAGAFLAVISADPKSEGGIVHLKYKPRGAKKRLSLVGKGLCFDTGGYNIKTPGDHMYSMHRDMTGSAVALGIFEALVETKAPYEVHAFLALAENLISPTGYKPNEVVLTMDGTSIEVVDTDAEGRMVLSDTLIQATQVKPDLILDFATLTGAAVYSIGTRRAALFSNDMKLAELATKVGTQSGERGWHFPIGEDYYDNIKSEIADILQCSTSRGVDHINAASFLAKFVGEIPWVHVDLSTDENKGGLGLVSSDVTGFGVRWGIHFIEALYRK